MSVITYGELDERKFKRCYWCDENHKVVGTFFTITNVFWHCLSLKPFDERFDISTQSFELFQILSDVMTSLRIWKRFRPNAKSRKCDDMVEWWTTAWATASSEEWRPVSINQGCLASVPIRGSRLFISVHIAELRQVSMHASHKSAADP